MSKEFQNPNAKAAFRITAFGRRTYLFSSSRFGEGLDANENPACRSGSRENGDGEVG
jgi:hypothetical protein